MTKVDLMTMLTELLEPVAEQRGFELVAVEQSGGRHTPVIRVMLDRDGGLTLDDIYEANVWVSEIVEGADPFGGPYTLEVSSPGVDRPLRKLSDFDRFSGQTATVKVRAPHGERSAWTGILVGTEGETVVLDVDGERVVVSHTDIVKARLKGVVSFNHEGDAI